MDKMDLRGRKESLRNYETRAQLAHTEEPAKEVRVRFDRSNVYEFMLRDDLVKISQKPHPEIGYQEDVCDGDMLRPLVAEVLIKLLPMAMNRRFNSDRVLLKAECNKILEKSLTLYHAIHENETRTICDLRSEASLQTLELQQRCEGRLEELGGKPQFVVARKQKEMANIAAEDTSPEELADFSEELLSRKPHKLTLCHSSGYGFDADHCTHQGLVILHETLCEI